MTARLFFLLWSLKRYLQHHNYVYCMSTRLNEIGPGIDQWYQHPSDAWFNQDESLSVSHWFVPIKYLPMPISTLIKMCWLHHLIIITLSKTFLSFLSQDRSWLFCNELWRCRSCIAIVHFGYKLIISASFWLNYLTTGLLGMVCCLGNNAFRDILADPVVQCLPSA